MKSATSSITSRLLTVVFSLYLLIALSVTAMHIIATYQDTESSIIDELQGYFISFSESVVLSRWEFDDEQLKSSLQGAMKIPTISGVKVVDHKGVLVMGLGNFQESYGKDKRKKPIKFQGSLIYRGPDIAIEKYLGSLTLYSSNRVVFDRVKLSLIFIIINAFVKTLALWLIFSYFGKRLLSKPLTLLTDTTKRLDFDNLENAEVAGGITYKDELATLKGAYNNMIQKLRHTKQERDDAEQTLRELNLSLQTRVEERTEEIENALKLQEQLNQELTERTENLDEANRKLQILATRDSLTGVLNRAEFLHLANTELARSNRVAGYTSIMLLDIDDFKSINDMHGHAIGDEVLTFFTHTCQECLRQQDVMGRIGGEEFAILLPGTKIAAAEKVADRIREKVAETRFDTLNVKLGITVSIGISELLTGEKLIDCALKRADLAMYQSKRDGRNRVTRALE